MFKEENPTMLRDEAMAGERQETLDELSDLLAVVQAMGQRLANETHGDSYAQVRKLNELLHRTRVQLTKIREDAGEHG
jgi:hypothetical protein